MFTDSYTTATFADKNVGTGKPVSVSGISISGTDAGNYTFNTTATTTADITARALTVTRHGVNKVYDGTTAATVTLSRRPGRRRRVHRQLHERDASPTRTSAPARRSASTGISIRGTDAGNYTLQHHGTTTADITARALTVTATGVNKVYDGTDQRDGRRSPTTASPATSSPTATRARRSPTRTSAPARRSRVSRHLDQRRRRRQLHGQHDHDDDRRHHRRAPDGHRHRRQQGLRRHHDGDGEPADRRGSPATWSPAATRARRSPQERRHRQGGQRHRHLDHRRRRRATTPANTTATHDREHHRAARSRSPAPTDTKVYDGTTTLDGDPDDDRAAGCTRHRQPARSRRRSTPRTSAPARRSRRPASVERRQRRRQLRRSPSSPTPPARSPRGRMTVTATGRQQDLRRHHHRDGDT